MNEPAYGCRKGHLRGKSSHAVLFRVFRVFRGLFSLAVLRAAPFGVFCVFCGFYLHMQCFFCVFCVFCGFSPHAVLFRVSVFLVVTIRKILKSLL